MITVERFLIVLEEKDLVPGELLQVLHNQAAYFASASDVAQLLIDKGYLTPALANRLMGVDIEQSFSILGEDESVESHEPEIGLAPIKEEIEPRPVIGKHRSYKPGDSGKSAGAAAPKEVKPPLPPPPPKPLIADNLPQSRWASSAYDRELDSSKGIVSPRLVKMAGVEQIPATVLGSKHANWLMKFFRVGIMLGIGVLMYLLIMKFVLGR